MKILVTGASRGIGRGIAIQLALSGHDVTITGRSQSTLDQVLIDFQKLNTENIGSLFCIKCDHSVDDEVDKLFEKFVNGLDVLINNAFSGVTALLTAKPNFGRMIPITGMMSTTLV